MLLLIKDIQIWGGGYFFNSWFLFNKFYNYNKIWLYGIIDLVSYNQTLLFLNLNYTGCWEQYRFISFIKSNLWISTLKITFKRKGSWMLLKRTWPRYITSKVGHSKSLKVGGEGLWYYRRKKHLQRHTLLLIGNIWLTVKNTSRIIKNWRRFGCYTKRGIRLAREIFLRRQGKISQYKHLKSKIF